MTIDPHVIFPDVTNNECHLTPENPVRENRDYVSRSVLKILNLLPARWLQSS